MPLSSGDDLGRRADHLMQLQDYWNTCYGILTTPGFHTMAEKERAKNLQIALDLLMSYASAGYDCHAYAKEINNLPKVEKDNHETT